jgi:predicted methyltransferase
MPDNIILSHYQVEPLLVGRTLQSMPHFMPLSLDLGITTTEIQITAAGCQLPDSRILTWTHLKYIQSEKNSCFILVDNNLEKVETFSPHTNRYYSLMPTSGAPTLLISGIPMHRIKDTTPDQDTRQKLKALGKPYGRILDTATGLGYTAIQAAHTADLVITIEYDPAVLDICRQNPWSQGLFTQPNIQPVIGDSGDLAEIFEEGTFNAILHDPPTFSLAGHLYSQEMYHTLHRILKPGGRLFHYIGNPDSRYGATTGRGVVARLQQAGFRVTPKGRAFGVLGVK